MHATRETHAVNIAGLRRDLPLFEVAPGVRIAVLNILGDTPLVEASARALAARLAEHDYELLVTAEAKSIPLIHALSVATGRSYVVLRKSYKSYMGEALSRSTHSITTGDEQTLYLDGRDEPSLRDARVVLIDDVISSGSTLDAMRRLVADAGGRVVAEAAILTEGDRAQWPGVIALGHVPIFGSAAEDDGA